MRVRRTYELCTACAAKRMAEMLPNGITLEKIAGGVNNKVTCWDCGRRRFGSTYELRKAAKK